MRKIIITGVVVVVLIFIVIGIILGCYHYKSNPTNTNDDSKNVVLITSKIYVSDVPFSYVKNRSIHTPQERYSQTFDTIHSIRKYIPNSYIILFDNSTFDQTQYDELNRSVDKFINITDNEELNRYTNTSPSKAYGELSQYYYTLPYLKALPFKVNHFFKISGRYVINEQFDYRQYDNPYNIFKQNLYETKIKFLLTCFYKIGDINEFIDVVDRLFNTVRVSDKYDNSIMEDFFPAQFNDVHLIKTLGVTQNIAVWNDRSKV